MIELLPPFWLVRVAVAAVWLYEGLWCKLLNGEPHQREVVKAVPNWGPRFGVPFLMALGLAPLWCAIAQTVLLVSLNANGILWARHVIHDPAGMVVKNFAFLVLAWVGASLPGWGA